MPTIETVKTFDSRTSTDISGLLGAPVSNPTASMPDGFYAKGSAVCYRSSLFLFGEDPIEEAPEEILVTAKPVEGNHSEMLSAQRVAQLVAAALNQYREEDLKRRGIR